MNLSIQASKKHAFQYIIAQVNNITIQNHKNAWRALRL